MLGLQTDKEISRAVLKIDQDGLIRYNHPQLIATHKAPTSNWE